MEFLRLVLRIALTCPMRVFRWFDERFFTILSGVVGVWCLLGVPQVSHLIGQWPLDPVERVLFGALVVLLALFYMITLIDMIHPLPPGWLTGWAGAVNGWLVAAASRMQGFSTGSLGYVLPLAMMAGGLYLAWWIPFDVNWPYQLSGGVLKASALWITLVGFFLLYGKIIGPGLVIEWARETRASRSASAEFRDDHHGPQRGTTKLDQSTREARSGWDRLGAVLSWIFVTSAIGELFWMTAVLHVPLASLRLYTVWALIHVVVAATVSGGLIDFFHRNSVLPARAFALVVLFLVIWFQGGEVIRDDRPDHILSAAEASAQWLKHLETRLTHMPDGPVVLVAASGGGSRAALFTSLVLEMLATEPMTLPSIDPPDRTETAEESGSTTPSGSANKPTWADHILMISSVSGGSMATARYVESVTAGPPSPAGTLKYTNRGELIRRTILQIEAWLADKRPAHADDHHRLNRVLEQVRRLEDAGSSREGAGHEGSSSRDSLGGQPNAEFEEREQRLAAITAKAFTAGIADEMSADFMAPLLRGLLTPFSPRGQGLYYFWQSEFQWTGKRLNRLLTAEEMQRRPLVLLNATDVDAGRRVIFGQPPVPESLRKPGTDDILVPGRAVPMPSEEQYAPVTARGLGGPDLEAITLTRAVRLSSNFPFGFTVAEFTAVPAGRLRLNDGGVVDNTGIDSIHAVFTGLHRAADRRPDGDVARLLAEIRCRGVVLIEIDSGAKPSAAAAGFTPFAGLAKPISALNNATYTNALRSSDYFTQDLRRMLSHWMPTALFRRLNRNPLPVAIGSETLSISAEQLRWAVPAVAAEYAHDAARQGVLAERFVCNHLSRSESHVMTALALGPQDKAIIIAQFLDQARAWHEGAADRSTIFENYRHVAQQFANAEPGNAARVDAVRDLLQAASVEMQTSWEALRKARDNRWLGPPEQPAQLAEAAALLMRPYVLLMGVRLLSEPGSEEFTGKGEQLTTMQRWVGELFDDATRPAEVLIAANAEPPVPAGPGSEPIVTQPDRTAEPRIPATEQILERLRALPRAQADELAVDASRRLQDNRMIEHKRDIKQQQTRNYYENLGGPNQKNATAD